MTEYFKHDLKNFEDLAVLAKSTYSGGEICDQKYLRWEYASNPFGEAIIYAGTNNEKVVSQYAVVPRGIISGDLKYNGSLSVNTITQPDFRGQGYFSRLAEMNYESCTKNGIDFTIGFPNKNSVNSFIGKLKFSNIGFLPLMVKTINLSRAIKRFLVNRNEDGGEISVDLKFQSPEISILDLENDISKYNEFWNEFNKRNVFTTDRSIEFMKWRYQLIPIRKYHLFKCETDGKIDSIIVFRAKIIKGVRCGIIVDYLTLRKNSGINMLVRELEKKDLDLIISTAPEGTIESTGLKSAGFYKLPDFLMFKKLYMIIRIHSGTISKSITDFNKWFITFGDYDIF